jgi:predicted RNA-binding protein
LQEFLLSEENLWTKELAGLKPVTPAFDKAWKAIAKKDPLLFRNAQFAFMHRTNYLPTVATVEKATKVNLDTFSSAVRAPVFSAANQHGKASKPLIWAVNATNELIKANDPNYERVLIQQIYAQRAKYVVGVAKKNGNAGQKKQLQSLVKKRYIPEEADALAELPPAT